MDPIGRMNFDETGSITLSANELPDATDASLGDTRLR
jgi:hypothetical protein